MFGIAPLQRYPNVQVLKFSKCLSITWIGPKQNPVRFEDEGVVCLFNEPEQAKQMLSAYRRFIPADSKLRIPVLLSDCVELSEDLRGVIKASNPLGIRQWCPTPAKCTAEATSDAISSCYAAVKSRSTKAIVLAFIAACNYFLQSSG